MCAYFWISPHMEALECGVVEHKEEMNESEVTPIEWVSDVGDTLNSEH